MAATIKMYRYTGAGPTGTDISSINDRVDGFDSHTTADTSNPVPIPASSSNYSYWAVYQFYCAVAPATLVNNLKWYTSGSNTLGTGVGQNVNTATAYTQATGSGGIGTQLTTGNYASLAGAPTNAFAYTSGSPLSVTGSTSTTGAFGNYIVSQFTVGTTAAAGATGQATYTYQWDEY